MADGTQYWHKEGKLHRDGDLPAIIYANGSQRWYKEDKLYRDGDLPAIIWADGTQYWHKEDKLHREGDLPAIIGADGTQAWYKEGKLHREGDLPAVVRTDGRQEWWIHGTKQKKPLNAGIYPLNLPLGIQYCHKEGKSSTTKLEECPICYEEIQDCDLKWQCVSVVNGYVISNHPYFFHAECILKSCPYCPYCRSPISNIQECTEFVCHYSKKE